MPTEMFLERARKTADASVRNNQYHDRAIIAAELADALVDDTTWAYLAGIIDGEGTIGLTLITTQRRGGYKHLRPYIHVSNTNLKLFGYLNIRIAQRPLVKQHGDAKRKPVYVWKLQAWPLIEVMLKNCLPYLILKGEQAKLLLEWHSNKQDKRFIKGSAIFDEKGHFLGHRKIEIPNEELAYWREMKRLNKRGRHDEKGK